MNSMICSVMEDPKKTPAQLREQKKTAEAFKIGDEMLKVMEERPFLSNTDLCKIFAERNSERDERTYDGIFRTVKAFPPADRHPEVGFTKHQVLAEVSQKNVARRLKAIPTLEQWRQARAKALELIHKNDIKVNDLAQRGQAKILLADCLREILGQKS